MDTAPPPRRDPAPADDPRTPGAHRWNLYLWVVAAVLLVDVVTKAAVERMLPLYQPVPVLGEFFRLTYIFNRGAAFGLHFGGYSRLIFVVLTVAVVGMLAFWYHETPARDRLRMLSIALVTGGALGNLLDRIRSARGVVDFLDFGLGSLRWPVFNVADLAVTGGALLLALSLWREKEHPEA